MEDPLLLLHHLVSASETVKLRFFPEAAAKRLLVIFTMLLPASRKCATSTHQSPISASHRSFADALQSRLQAFRKSTRERYGFSIEPETDSRRLLARVVRELSKQEPRRWKPLSAGCRA